METQRMQTERERRRLNPDAGRYDTYDRGYQREYDRGYDQPRQRAADPYYDEPYRAADRAPRN